MTEGKGFSRRITLDDIERVAALLSPPGTRQGREKGPTGAEDDSEIVNRSHPDDPAVAAAEALFDGESFRVEIGHRPPRRMKREPTDRGEPTRPSPVSVATDAAIDPATFGSLVWVLQRIDASTAQHPPKSKSNPTGNVKLGVRGIQVQVPHGVTRRNYFREVLFGQLPWSMKPSGREEAETRFRVEIGGTDLEEHTLTLSHNPVRIQDEDKKNVPTWLHWGNAVGAHLREHDYTGSRLELFAPRPGGTVPYLLRIVLSRSGSSSGGANRRTRRA